MNNHIECVRGYHRTNKAWYSANGNRKTVEVMFGMYHPDGGTSGEMAMEWINLGVSYPSVAQLKSFEDSWGVLALFNDLILKLSEFDSKNIQEEEFIEILNKCGFKDLTQYEEI